MQRVLIVGTSESGKSTLARRLISAHDVPVFVRDPVLEKFPDAPGWPNKSGEFSLFKNSAELERLIYGVHGSPCIAVIDESVDFFKHNQTENHWIFTNGRHSNMTPIAIAHRIKMFSPNVREVATDVYVFESSIQSAEILAEDYNATELLAASSLTVGEFFHHRRVAGKRVTTRHALWTPEEIAAYNNSR